MSCIEFTIKQQEAFEAVKSEKFNFIVYGGAIRGGKSIWGLCTLLILCEVFPGSRWAVVRENSERIRTTTMPSFNKIEKSGLLRQNPYEYRTKKGSVIIFIGENYDRDKDLDAWKGLEVNGFLFEEINECQQQTLYKAFERAGAWIIPNSKHQPKPIVMATCNPTNGWMKDMVYKPYNEGRLPASFCYIPAKITDNPHLPEEYIDSLKNLPRYQYEVFVLGNWDIQLKTGGEFYKSFELDKHVKPVKYNSSLPLHISWDDNVNPFLPCGVFQIEGKRLIMIDEILGVTPNNTVKSVCAEFSRKYYGHNSGLFVYGDATANKEDTKMEKGTNFFSLVMDHLKSFRPVSRVQRSNPSVVMRGNWINNVLETNLGGIEIVIGEDCKTAINDFVLLKEAADGTKAKEMETNPLTKIRYQKVGHMSDLFDYLITTAFADDYNRYLNKPKSNIRGQLGRLI